MGKKTAFAVFFRGCQSGVEPELTPPQGVVLPLHHRHHETPPAYLKLEKFTKERGEKLLDESKRLIAQVAIISSTYANAEAVTAWRNGIIDNVSSHNPIIDAGIWNIFI